jgi:hypothetical protein
VGPDRTELLAGPVVADGQLHPRRAVGAFDDRAAHRDVEDDQVALGKRGLVRVARLAELELAQDLGEPGDFPERDMTRAAFLDGLQDVSDEQVLATTAGSAWTGFTRERSCTTRAGNDHGGR